MFKGRFVKGLLQLLISSVACYCRGGKHHTYAAELFLGCKLFNGAAGLRPGRGFWGLEFTDVRMVSEQPQDFRLFGF